MASSRKSKASSGRVALEDRVAQRIRDIVRPADRVAIGLSGGVDSVALFDILTRLAPRLLTDPERWGSEYDAYMRQLVPIHATFDYFALTPREAFEPEGLQRFSDQFVATNLSRLASAARMDDHSLAAIASPLFSWAFYHPGTVRGYCPIRRLPDGRIEAS